MKKLLSMLLVLAVSLGILVGCSGNNNKATEKTKVNIVALKGPTGMGMVSLMDESEKGKTDYNYNVSLVDLPDEVAAKVVKGEVDIAAVPANQAAALYQKTDKKVKLLAVHTIGNLTIVSNNKNIKTIGDLKGKTVYNIGKGASPEYVLNYLLEKNGLTPGKDVKVEYKSHAEELTALMAKDKIEVALMPYPFATIALQQNKDYQEVIDLNHEWEKVSPKGSKLTTGYLIVRDDYLQKNKEIVNKFLSDYQKSTQFVTTNLDQSAPLIEKYGILKAAVAKAAIPKCGITYIDGDNMKTAAKSYLEILFKSNPKSVGGALPDENFYYQK